MQITLNDARIEKTFCSCPYDWGGICKHIVATLLVLVHGSDQIEEKQGLASLLAGLTADQLRRALLGVAASGLEFAEAVEREISWLGEQPATPDGQSATTVVVDINAVRREIRKDFRLGGQGDPFESGYYDEYAALEMNPDLFLMSHLEKMPALLDAGDVKTAVSLITVIIDTFNDGLTDLGDYIYEYNEDVFSEATLTMGASLAEVLLSQEMQPDKQDEWLSQIADWERGLGDMDIAETAVKQGWTYPPLAAV
ncbi:MAG: hypothetical protein GY805_15660, partial [Chloroflexi bacterium]|nr:hypothetical protein [Chloroflexota bacterium]